IGDHREEWWQGYAGRTEDVRGNNIIGDHAVEAVAVLRSFGIHVFNACTSRHVLGNGEPALQIGSRLDFVGHTLRQLCLKSERTVRKSHPSAQSRQSKFNLAPGVTGEILAD